MDLNFRIHLNQLLPETLILSIYRFVIDQYPQFLCHLEPETDLTSLLLFNAPKTEEIV